MEKSNGEKDTFIGWLFEAIMRLKAFGPDAEILGDDLGLDADDF